jgi:phosphocarrier protein
MTLVRQLEITNKRGLHARASAKFVKCVESFDADITVAHEGQSVPGTSILGLMMLAATTGSVIEVAVNGPEAETAMQAISELLADRFGEDRDGQAGDQDQAG